MTTAFYLLVSIALLLIIPKLISYILFNNEVKHLLSLSIPIVDKKFSYIQLESLPEPVQRYFKLVLKDGQPYISYVRMTHAGKFKTGFDKDWIDIKGEQYATTEQPGFIWKGTTTMFTARDMYIEDKGRLIVSLFNLINIVDGQGEQYNQGELIRWLGESVLYPTNLLPSERLKWTAINENSAKLTFNYHSLSLFFIITFNEMGEITQMETKRYLDQKNLETWIINLANYNTINSVVVPTAFEVLWRLPKGDFSYAKFYLKKIEYDIAEKF